jgi:catechol 2,3-dioxygenase-like lactoylglutathione lyase family enzyme
MTTPTGLDHIDIVVDDVAQMRAFFETVGFAVIRETDHGGGAVELRFPGAGDQPILELTPRQGANGALRPLGLRHMALRTDDIEATLADLTAKGLRVDKPPRVIAETGRRLANLIDPVGNSLQIVES